MVARPSVASALLLLLTISVVLTQRGSKRLHASTAVCMQLLLLCAPPTHVLLLCASPTHISSTKLPRQSDWSCPSFAMCQPGCARQGMSYKPCHTSHVIQAMSYKPTPKLSSTHPCSMCVPCAACVCLVRRHVSCVSLTTWHLSCV